MQYNVFLGEEKRKEGTDIVMVVFHGLIGHFRRTNPSYLGCSYWHLQPFHLFWKSSFWLRVTLFFPLVV